MQYISNFLGCNARKSIAQNYKRFVKIIDKNPKNKQSHRNQLFANNNLYIYTERKQNLGKFSRLFYLTFTRLTYPRFLMKKPQTNLD